MHRYLPSGKFETAGLLIAGFCGLLGGYLAGLVLFSIKHFLIVYLILVFPAAVAWIAGIVLRFGIKRGKLRSPKVAVALGVMAAIVLWTVDHHQRYQTEFLGEIRQELASAGKPIKDTNQTADLILREMTGSSGFLGFLKLETNLTVAVSRVNSPKPPASGSNGLLMIVEFLIISVVTAGMGLAAASDPFDETVQEWYGKAKPILCIAHPQFDPALAALGRSQFDRLRELHSIPDATVDRIIICLRRTSSLRSAMLEITQHSLDERGKLQRKTLMQGVINQTQLEQLMGTAPAPETAPVPTRTRPPLEDLPAASRTVQPTTTDNGHKLGRG